MKHSLNLFRCILTTVVFTTFLHMTNAGCNPENQFECDNGSCIMFYMRCDGTRNCPNSEDEEGCDSVTCPDGFPFQCSNGRCIPQSWVCDLSFSQDCLDGSDQMNCPFQCSGQHFFQCDDTVCVLEMQRCDGISNCPDGSDEVGCHTGSQECNRRQFTCDSGACIPKRRVCDQDPDCPDQEDEEDCPGDRLCDEFSFRCDNGVCIFKYQTCNGYNDCKNGEDESNELCSVEPFLTDPPKCFVCDSWTKATKSCGRHVEHCEQASDQCATTYTLNKRGKAVYTSGCVSEDYCINAHEGKRKCDLSEQDECIFCCDEDKCNKFNRRPKITTGR